MDSFEFNKMAGAVLGTLLFLMGLGIFSDALFAVPRAAKPGYDLPAVEEAKAGAAPAVASAEPPPVLLAKADAKKGENLIKACATCHTFDAAGSAKPTGPNLYGIVNRKIGSASYAYSDNMKNHGGNWDYAALDKFIANPKGYIANTKMSYGGEKDPAKRADLIAYLRSLAATPAPLPNP